MELEELLGHNANEVRRNASLLSEFQRHYKEKIGSSPCLGCSFQSSFNRLKTANNTVLKRAIMTEHQNTFTLREKKRIMVPFSSGRVITDSSPDELVEQYITFHFENVEPTDEMKAARAANFLKLPDGFSLDAKEDESEKPDQECSLKELRKRYPDVKSNSRDGFLAKLNPSPQDEEE